MHNDITSLVRHPGMFNSDRTFRFVQTVYHHTRYDVYMFVVNDVYRMHCNNGQRINKLRRRHHTSRYAWSWYRHPVSSQSLRHSQMQSIEEYGRRQGSGSWWSLIVSTTVASWMSRGTGDWCILCYWIIRLATERGLFLQSWFIRLQLRYAWACYSSVMSSVGEDLRHTAQKITCSITW